MDFARSKKGASEQLQKELFWPLGQRHAFDSAVRLLMHRKSEDGIQLEDPTQSNLPEMVNRLCKRC
jgi:hypothetical protein